MDKIEQELLLYLASSVAELLKLEGSRDATRMRDEINRLKVLLADRAGFVVKRL